MCRRTREWSAWPTAGSRDRWCEGRGAWTLWGRRCCHTASRFAPLFSTIIENSEFLVEWEISVPPPIALLQDQGEFYLKRNVGLVGYHLQHRVCNRRGGVALIDVDFYRDTTVKGWTVLVLKKLNNFHDFKIC